MKRFLDVLLQFLFGLALPMLAWVIFGKTVARIGEPDVFDGFEWQAIGMGVMAIVGFAVARRLNAKESSAWMVTTNFMVNLVRGTPLCQTVVRQLHQSN
ncbi:hypothetical protein [Massilia sp. TWP1-3-3]|uniref:hypothetical protein n=1 Tax=Massilia sp. TWP1-3-3 TaxID=2804573 RepID=UPI003CEB6211